MSRVQIIFLCGLFLVAHSCALAQRPSLRRALSSSYRLVDKLRETKGSQLNPEAQSEKRMGLLLEQCITLALMNNLSIRLAVFPDQKLAQDVSVARAIFDPNLAANVDYQDSTSQATSRLQAAGQNEEQNMGANLSLSKKLEDGTEVSMSWDSGRRKTNSPFFIINPVYSSTLALEARKSLTKLRGRDLNLAELRQLEHQRAAARCELHATINDVMYGVVESFLNLRQQDANLTIQEQSLEQVKELVEITRKRMLVGRAVEAQLIKDQSQLARQKEELIVTRANREQACDQLLQLICPDPEERPDPSRLEAILEIPKVLEREINFTGLSRSARQKRPEVLAMLCQMRSQDLALRLARDGVKPTFDVVAGFGLQANDGTFSDANSAVGTLDYPVYTLGLQYSIPLGMRASKGRMRRAKLEREELDVRLLELEAAIELEVRQALRGLRSSMERMAAARSTVNFAERSYTNEKLLYRQGRTTPFQVNEYRIDLDDARLRLAEAMRDYLLALAAIRKAEGTLPDIFAKKGRLNAKTLAFGLE